MNYNLLGHETAASVPDPSPTVRNALAVACKNDLPAVVQLACLRKAMHMCDAHTYDHSKVAAAADYKQAAAAVIEVAEKARKHPSSVPHKDVDALYNQFCSPGAPAVTNIEAASLARTCVQADLLIRTLGTWDNFLKGTDMTAMLKTDHPPRTYDGVQPTTPESRFAALAKYDCLKGIVKAPPPPPRPPAATTQSTYPTAANNPTPPAGKQPPQLPWQTRRDAAAAAPASAATAPSMGGFMTATDQYNMDVQSGKIPPGRPAIGLKRPNAQPSIDNVIAATHKNAGQKKKDDGGDDECQIPPSLLLPDGTLHPRLEGLEPKLLTQVAMEILDAKGTGTDWSDIAGLSHAKASVEEAIVWPLLNPELFTGLRDPPRGLLLFGPPGTGKTMIARAIASRAGCTFMNISASSLMSKWVGEGEKLVRCMFAVACVKQPTVVFIDEIDSLLSMRSEGEMDAVRRVKTEFLVQMDGVGTDRNDRVLLIGATNRPEELDEAARRRMEKRLYIPLPDAQSRTELLRRLITTHSHNLTDEDFEILGADTDGYSGADIKGLAREAAMGPVRSLKAGATGISSVNASDVRPVSMKDCKNAVRRIKPSVGSAELVRYESWNDQYGSFPMTGGDNSYDDE